MSDQPRPAGRASDYTQEAADEICERLAQGEPLAVICRDLHLPAYRTVYDWKYANPDFAANIARARQDGGDAIAERLRATSRGVNMDNGGDSTGDVARDKLIIETDLKLLAKWFPKTYGDRQEVEHTGNVTMVMQPLDDKI